MVAPLTDEKSVRELSTGLHNWFSEGLQIPIRKRDEKLQPALQPESRQNRPAQALYLLTQRFPTVHTGRRLHYPDVYVAKQEVLDVDKLSCVLWRLLLWLFLGIGRCQHRAWHAIKGMPCAKSYTGQKTQPREHDRLARAGQEISPRHQEVFLLVRAARTIPALVRAFQDGPEQFHAMVAKMPGLRGELRLPVPAGFIAYTAAAGDMSYKDIKITMLPKVTHQDEVARLHVASWNLGGMSPDKVLDLLVGFQGMPCAKSYTGQKTQPREVLRFVCPTVFLLVRAARTIPALVRAFQDGPEQFHAMVAKMPGRLPVPAGFIAYTAAAGDMSYKDIKITMLPKAPMTNRSSCCPGTEAHHTEVTHQDEVARLHFASWNLGGMSPDKVLDLFVGFQGCPALSVF
ncbi:unnamed protein product [Symbiodinium sp. CCMP2592]|nr:unnamed protein product [Symbiodinium sp. CCMP2592]